MDGWHIRRGVAGDLSGDVGWFIGAVMLVGAAFGAAAAFLWDHAICHHREQARQRLR